MTLLIGIAIGAFGTALAFAISKAYRRYKDALDT
jgi:hypothetical protein